MSENRPPEKKYRFGFALTTAAGNKTRYLNLRKYADQDPEVECVWAPVSHYLDPDPYRRLPGAIRNRLIVMKQSAPVMSQLDRLDAVMYHVFEPYALSVLRRATGSGPLVAWSQDNPPFSDPAKHPSYGGVHARPPWRARLRYQFDAWCVRKTDLFFPWSQWAASVLVEDCHAPADTVHPLHVGMDLELWPYLPKTETDKARLNILFVGGNFIRKGGDLLLRVYNQHFAGRADLHLVTQEPPADLPPNVFVHTGLGANDPRLRKLYEQADSFVLPTRADVSSIVSLEAMATGRPVIATRMGGIPDIVAEGETGYLIEPDDAEALTKHMTALLEDASLRRRMGERGRARAEERFSAAKNVARILEVMKDATLERRA